MIEHAERFRQPSIPVGRIQTGFGSEIPEMIPIREVCRRIPGLSYDYLRKGCLSGKIVHIRVGNGKFLVNFGKLVERLNSNCGEG